MGLLLRQTVPVKGSEPGKKKSAGIAGIELLPMIISVGATVVQWSVPGVMSEYTLVVQNATTPATVIKTDGNKDFNLLIIKSS